MSDLSRPVTYLRISITDRCNFRCRYCKPKDRSDLVSHHDVATYEEIVKIVKVCIRLGITKVRVTGGEPFVRKGILDFLEKLCLFPELKDISVTTNGSLLNRGTLIKLHEMGIRRLNFSLDTLNREKFTHITGHDRFDKVWRNIRTASEIGMAPVKINTVLLKGINDDETEDLAELSVNYPFHVRFIEYMPIGSTSIHPDQQILTPEVKHVLKERFGALQPVAKSDLDGPAKRFRIKDAKGEVGFITPVSNHFCSSCNRIRLVATGGLRPCLLHDHETDILTPLRSGASCDDIEKLVIRTIKSKPAAHNLMNEHGNCVAGQMTSIGG